jgi:Mor family transcriptional regulator
MTSSIDNEDLIYEILKTLYCTSTEYSKCDFFKDSDGFNVFELSTYFGLPEQDIQGAITRFAQQREKQQELEKKVNYLLD